MQLTGPDPWLWMAYVSAAGRAADHGRLDWRHPGLFLLLVNRWPRFIAWLVVGLLIASLVKQ
jgi:hypothetical protein